ncbi:DUF2130 domain-containing protein [Candidatus Microgenomates bacterium]|nr:MAG: DUF2130 domain-containing protein [Candidatus Microgenomates bacterium]
MPNSHIKCPHCGKEVSIDEALSHAISDKIRKEAEVEFQTRANKENEELVRDLEEKQKKISELQNSEIALRKQKRELEDKEKELELTLHRKLDQEKQKIEEAAFKKADEEHRLKDLEKEKKLSDVLRANEELRRKLEQGSQQTQGEVLELDLELSLQEKFPDDTIEPVGKGVRGADIRQIVRPSGHSCGVILWEVKRTKAFSRDWITKLKADLRAEKANIPVLVTTTMPQGEDKPIISLDGVFVCLPPHALVLAEILREQLVKVARVRYQFEHSSKDRAEELYTYITSHAFVQKIESLFEIYTEAHSQIQSERAAYERLWKRRELQAKKLFDTMSMMNAEMKAIAGNSMPQVKGLDLPELESGD